MTGAGYVFPLLFDVGRWMFLALVILVFVELFLLYHERGMMASRTLSERFSNGDDNEVNIRVESIYSFPVRLEIIDEIPPAFQRRDVLFRLKLAMGEGKNIV